MPLRAVDNPLVLPLLGLVVEGRRHPYAMLTELRSRYRHLRVRTGTVYTLLKSLEEAGWLSSAAEQDTGAGAGGRAAGAPRTVYALTPAGAAELRRRVVADLADVGPEAEQRFVTALAYLGSLDREQAVATLAGRRDALQARAAELEAALHAAPVPEIFMIEVAYLLSRTRHDLAWLDEAVTRIRSGGLSWPTAPAP